MQDSIDLANSTGQRQGCRGSCSGSSLQRVAQELQQPEQLEGGSACRAQCYAG